MTRTGWHLLILGEGEQSILVGVTISAPHCTFKTRGYTFSKPCSSIKKKNCTSTLGIQNLLSYESIYVSLNWQSSKVDIKLL